MYPNFFIEVCFNKYYRVCLLIQVIDNVFHFIITSFENYSDMCEIETVLVAAALLLAATGFCIYQVKVIVGHHSKIKSESPCEKEYKKYCLNGGECYYLVDEDIVACNCRWFYGGKLCERYMWWT